MARGALFGREVTFQEPRRQDQSISIQAELRGRLGVRDGLGRRVGKVVKTPLIVYIQS